MKELKEIIKENSPQFESYIYGKINEGHIKTEFSSLDKLIGGFLSDELIVLGARPGMGKTTLMIKLALNQAKKGKKVIIYSLDLSAPRIILTLIAFLTDMNAQELNCGLAKEEDREKINEAIKIIEALPILIEDSNKTIDEIRDELLELKAKEGVDMIYLDYLQLLGTNHRKPSYKEQEICSIMKKLKHLTKEINTPIFVNSSLSRSVETRGGDKRPQLSDLRESGSIEEFADKVFFILRPEYYGLTEDEDHNSTENMANLILAKNRNGFVGEIKLYYKHCNGNFDDLNNIEMINYLKDEFDYGL